MTDRAVSTVVGYVLMVGIAAILLAGLTFAASSIVENQDSRTTQTELEVYGERLAADLMTADRLVQQGASTDVSVTAELPRRVGGDPYTISFDDAGPESTTITLESEGTERSVETGVTHETTIATDEVESGTLTITYDPGADALVITND